MGKEGGRRRGGGKGERVTYFGFAGVIHTKSLGQGEK